MRFDLTVNEFTRDLWADRELEVFGEQFWRPYVHVRDAGRGVARAGLRPDKVAGRVFNVGHSDENYRKLDLVEIITGQLGRGNVSYVTKTRTRATTRSASSGSSDELGFEPAQARARGHPRDHRDARGAGASAIRTTVASATPEYSRGVGRASHA